MTMADFGFADVLSVEAMVSDLQRWSPVGWSDRLDRYRGWTIELFDFLAGLVPPDWEAGGMG
jgi:hypothetical protein